MKVVIIIPTYNEHDNMVPLFTALQQQFADMAEDMHILVVDDHSPDGTGALVRSLAAGQPNLHLIEGQKAGLGVAYMRGMAYAMDQLQADAVFEMDADFSHDPADVPRLLQALVAGADFVIGSRYVPGGTIPVEWGPMRKLNSMFGNIVARYLAGMYRIHDCTAGFRAIRGSVLRQIDFSALNVKGYAFQVALLHQAVTLGAVVQEIPVHFKDRTRGDSKLGLSDIIEFILAAWWIRLRSLKTFCRFGMVGLSGAVVNLGLFSLFMHQGMHKLVASPVAIECSILTNFLLNNYWTFKDRKSADRTHIKGLKFNVVSLLSLVVSYGTFVALGLLLPWLSPQWDQLIGIAPAMLVNYFFNAYWTFRSAQAPSASRRDAVAGLGIGADRVAGGSHRMDPAARVAGAGVAGDGVSRAGVLGDAVAGGAGGAGHRVSGAEAVIGARTEQDPVADVAADHVAGHRGA
jgi:dolichol-phosphate mannosyltransferase